MGNIGAVHKLALFYIGKMKVGEKFKQRFWKNNYGYNEDEIIPFLMKRDLITKGFDLNTALNSMRIPEIKELLRRNELKLSGNKKELIARIQENADLIDLSTLPQYYVLTDKGEELKYRSGHIDYFHRNAHEIDIFKAENIHKKHKNLSSDELIEKILINETEKNLNKKEYFSASYYSDRLAYFYNDKNDYEKEISQILLSMICSVLQEYRYKELLEGFRGDDKMTSIIIGYNKNLQIKFKGYLDKHNIERLDAKRMISDMVNKINYKIANVDDVAEIILYALEGKDEKVNKIFNNRVNERKAPSINHTDTVKKTNNNIKKSGCLNSGCLTFIALPTIAIIYTLTRFIF